KLKRLEKRRAEAREAVERPEEALRRAEAQVERLTTQAQRDAELGQARQMDEALSQLDRHLSELDKAVEALAKSCRNVLEDKALIVPLSQQHVHWPDLFHPGMLQARVEQRLYGLTEGKWMGRWSPGLETPFTA